VKEIGIGTRPDLTADVIRQHNGPQRMRLEP
jgi:hypothetical protein